MFKNKVLFLLKRREDYNQQQHSTLGLKTGLFNSASFMNDMLNDLDIQSKMSIVVDSNSIDREVFQYKPTHVIIEALWTTPVKMTELSKLHPSVKWIIRLHSNIPFIANEGIAMDWIGDLSRIPSLMIAANTEHMLRDISFYLSQVHLWNKKQIKEKVLYLPNYYPQTHNHKKFTVNKGPLNIGCFGAIRPMKNHLLQAIAAIKFADSIGRKVNFHVNAGRVEQKGEPVLSNLIGLFQNISNKGHELVTHDWEDREEFLKLCNEMDIGMQVSLSETFNIVAADFINQGVPIVVSREIPWAHSWFCASPTNSMSIRNRLWLAHEFPQYNVYKNQKLLNSYTDKSKQYWKNYFGDKQ